MIRTPTKFLAIVALCSAAAAPAVADTVLITGANSGLGLEFARQYAALGWTVIATHRRSGVPDTLVPLVAEYPSTVRVERMDVASIAEVDECTGPVQAEDDICGLHIAVNERRRECVEIVKQMAKSQTKVDNRCLVMVLRAWCRPSLQCLFERGAWDKRKHQRPLITLEKPLDKPGETIVLYPTQHCFLSEQYLLALLSCLRRCEAVYSLDDDLLICVEIFCQINHKGTCRVIAELMNNLVSAAQER